jgi:D-lactate dehydrogenase
VFAEGDPGRFMFIVSRGQIRVFKRANNREVQIDQLRAGDCGGITSMFLNQPRSATLQAVDDVAIWALDQDGFDQLLETDRQFARALLSFMSEQMRRESTVLARLTPKAEGTGLRVAVFDTKSFTRETFTAQNRQQYALTFFEHRLNEDTVNSAMGFPAICIFVNDQVTPGVAERLSELGVELVALRAAGYNNVDLAACENAGLTVVRVPEYSPQSVAEHAVALMLALNRHLTRAHARVREGNFSLDGLVGFEMSGRTAGVVGTGRIGKCAAKILLGFGCRVLAFDVRRDEELASLGGVEYVDMDRLLRESDIITLHVPLMPQTRHIINAAALEKMKAGVMIVNTSRGGLVDTQALIDGMKSGHIGNAGLDVYEEESEYFFEDYSGLVIQDDVLARLLTFPNVIVTSHQAFLTREALANIADTTFANIQQFQEGKRGHDLRNGVCIHCAK